jgi:hypothetical protein
MQRRRESIFVRANLHSQASAHLCSVIIEIRHDSDGEYYHLATARRVTQEEDVDSEVHSLAVNATASQPDSLPLALTRKTGHRQTRTPGRVPIGIPGRDVR